jgi:GNAT superfamily N-acetyltransferase
MVDLGEQTAAALTVRAASVEDAPGVARVQVASWRVAYRGLMPQALIDAQDEDKRRALWQRVLGASEHGVHVAVRAGQVIGFCQLVLSRDAAAPAGTGEVAAIYVDPEHWRSGAGRALLKAGVGLALQRGYRALTLWVLEANSAARRFYERQGLAPDGETKLDIRAGGTLFEVRYRRELAPAEDVV